MSNIVASEPHRLRRPFWLWVDGLFALDMPWLLDGVVNMAPPKKGTTYVTTVVVSGSTAGLLVDAVNLGSLEATKATGTSLYAAHDTERVPWKFNSQEESALEFVGTEMITIDQTKILTKHYVLGAGSEPKNLWVAGDGILVKIDEFILANYKQRKPLIPDIKIESQPTD